MRFFSERKDENSFEKKKDDSQICMRSTPIHLSQSLFPCIRSLSGKSKIAKKTANKNLVLTVFGVRFFVLRLHSHTLLGSSVLDVRQHGYRGHVEGGKHQ